MMKNTLKKSSKPLKAITKTILKSNALLKEATIAAERVAQQNKDFEITNRLQRAQYEEISKMVEAVKTFEGVPGVLEA